MVVCLVCKGPVEPITNHIEQMKKKKYGSSLFVCSSCQAKILFEAKKKEKEG